MHYWNNGGSVYTQSSSSSSTAWASRSNRSASGPVVGCLGPHSTFAMAAAACFLRGTAGRPQDLVRLRYSYVHDRYPNGFDFIYPTIDPVTQQSFTRKGKHDVAARQLLMPECLDDGLDIAATFRCYMIIAPRDGPLFPCPSIRTLSG